jgi:hypothetical protein
MGAMINQSIFKILFEEKTHLEDTDFDGWCFKVAVKDAVRPLFLIHDSPASLPDGSGC